MLKVVLYRELRGEELTGPIGAINSFENEEHTIALAKRSLDRDFRTLLASKSRMRTATWWLGGRAPMPKDPRAEKRPVDAVACAVMVARIATGKIDHEREAASSAAVQLGRLWIKKRPKNITPEQQRIA